MSAKRYTDQHRASNFLLHCSADDMKSNTWSPDHIQITLLADIRDTLVEIRTEMRSLNNVFKCRRVQDGFGALRSLAHTEAGRLRDARAREKRKAKR